MPRLRHVAVAVATLLLLIPLLHRRARAQEPTADSAKTKPRLQVSGYVQFFFKARFDRNGDSQVEPSVFRMQRVRISFEGRLSRRVGYQVSIDPRAPEISGVLRDAYISLSLLPHHKIRLGQQKTQFGYENRESSSRLFVVNRAELSDNLSRGVNLRDIGVGLIGAVPLGGAFELEDAITVVNGSGLNVQADSTARKNVWGRLGLVYKVPGRSVQLGLSGGTGDQLEAADPGPPPASAFTIDFTRWGADLEIDHPLGFAAVEYARGRNDAPASSGASGTSNGWYVLVAAKTPWHVGPMVRYDKLDDFHRWTLGGFYGKRTADVRVLVNYEILKEGGGSRDDRFYFWMQTRF